MCYIVIWRGENNFMKVGIISTNDKLTSLLSEGGTEVFCANLAYNLTKRGLDVTLFAAVHSNVNGVKIIETTEAIDKVIEQTDDLTAEGTQYVRDILQLRNIMLALKYEKDFDVIHNNMLSELSYAMVGNFSTPIVTSIHTPISFLMKNRNISKYILYNRANVIYVATSKHQQQQLPVNSRLICNGIDSDRYGMYGYKNTCEDLIWIGRVSETTPKGLEEALIVSKILGMKLRYRALVESNNYFNNKIFSLLNENSISIPSFETIEDKILFYISGKALLYPLKWEEPFGLIFIEAMAAGTPVIAYARGSVPDLIIDGKTGFIVNESPANVRGDWIIKENGINGLISAVKKLYSLTSDEYYEMRMSCVEHVRKNFSINSMIEKYIDLYRSF